MQAEHRNKMKTLCILRHAKSSWNEPDLSDHDRVLNKRGLRDAPRMGAQLVARGISPDAFVSSTAVRARNTARLAMEAMGIDIDKCELREDLYLASARGIAAVAAETDDTVDTLLLCGHNPGMTDVVSLLTDDDFAHLPTAGLVTLALDVESWAEIFPGCAELVYFDYPKGLA